MNLFHGREVVLREPQYIPDPKPGEPEAFGQGKRHEAGRQEPGLVEVDNTKVAGVSKDEVAGVEVTIIET